MSPKAKAHQPTYYIISEDCIGFIMIGASTSFTTSRTLMRLPNTSDYSYKMYETIWRVS